MGSCMSFDDASPKARKTWTKENDSETAEFLAREAKNDEQLACLECRMCTSGSSSIASIHTQQGKKGTNQDSMIIWENFGSREDTVFLGVFDGHGPYGHIVGRRVRDSLPSMLLNQWYELLSAEGLNPEATNFKKMCDVVEQDLQEEEPKMFGVWEESHLTAFKVMDKELMLHPTLDCHCSGSTAVTILKQGQDLVIAHVGDSRAVLGTISPKGSLSAVQLTIDMKANLPVPRDSGVVSKLMKASSIILSKVSLSEQAQFKSFNTPDAWSARRGQPKCIIHTFRSLILSDKTLDHPWKC